MRSLIILALIFLAQNLTAYEFKRNPDRRPSLGFNYSRNWTSGDYTIYNHLYKDAGEWLNENYIADFRFPLSQDFTITFGGGWIREEQKMIRFGDPTWNQDGYNVSAGVRIYFP